MDMLGAFGMLQTQSGGTRVTGPLGKVGKELCARADAPKTEKWWHSQFHDRIKINKEKRRSQSLEYTKGIASVIFTSYFHSQIVAIRY